MLNFKAWTWSRVSHFPLGAHTDARPHPGPRALTSGCAHRGELSGPAWLGQRSASMSADTPEPSRSFSGLLPAKADVHKILLSTSACWISSFSHDAAVLKGPSFDSFLSCCILGVSSVFLNLALGLLLSTLFSLFYFFTKLLTGWYFEENYFMIIYFLFAD